MLCFIKVYSAYIPPLLPFQSSLRVKWTILSKIFPLQHQLILTNVTVSKNSEIGLNMVVYENFFLLIQMFQRIKEMCGQYYIMEKY